MKLYEDERRIGTSLFLALLGEEEFVAWNKKIEMASELEQQAWLDEMASMDESGINSLFDGFDLPATAEEWATAKEWTIAQGELKRGNKPATVNRYLALIRNLLHMARDEWQWIDSFPKIRMLSGEVERDRWLTREEAERLIAACPVHLAALVRFALATGLREREITGLEWDRVNLSRHTAWLNQTKNGTPRGVPLNHDAVVVLQEQISQHPQFCFTYRGNPIKWDVTNTAWHNALKKAGLQDFRFHDLRHTWASWHRQAGTSVDELKDLGGWKSRIMVDRYAKYATEHLHAAASRIEEGRGGNVVTLSRFRHGQK